jgi:predicted RNase H-like nuclease (RuvC/YqgF family)
MEEIDKREELKQNLECKMIESTNSLSVTLNTVDDVKYENNELKNRLNESMLQIETLEQEKFNKINIESKIFEQISFKDEQINNFTEAIIRDETIISELNIELNNIKLS